MIVVADTTPLNYLLLIDQIDLLPALYQRVLIPHEVHSELQRPGTPPKVRRWSSSLPSWCEVRTLSNTPDAMLSELDAGERDAIQLALESGVDLLLIDDREGRREAQRRHLKVAGTLSVLEKAAHLGLIDFTNAIERLELTNFRLSARLRDEICRRNS